jgi:hypothetical protein
MKQSVPEQVVVRLIRDAFLPGPHNPSGQLIGADEWFAVVRAAEINGLAPLLYASLTKSGSRGDVPASPMEQLRIDYVRSDVAHWQVFRELKSLLALFEQERIPTVVLKGCALATTLYPDAALRPMADMDLLVPQADLFRVGSLLIEQGYSHGAELGKDYDKQFSYHQVFMRAGSRPALLEVHQHLFKSPYYWQRMPINWFWSRTTTIDMNSQNAQVFDPQAQFVHLSTHLALNHRAERLIWSFDLALFLAYYQTQIDWDQVIAAASRFELILPLQKALASVLELWQVVPPAEVSERLTSMRPSLKEKSAFALTNAPWTQARLALDVMGTTGWRNKLSIWAHHIFPSVDYMCDRYAIRIRYLVPLFYIWRLLDGSFKLVRSAIFILARR